MICLNANNQGKIIGTKIQKLKMSIISMSSHVNTQFEECIGVGKSKFAVVI